MRKDKNYADVRFSADVINAEITALKDICTAGGLSLTEFRVSTELKDTCWSYDNLQEFLADYRNSPEYAHLYAYTQASQLGVEIHVRPQDTRISVVSAERAQIESLFSIFESAVASSQLEPKPVPKPVIFIGHGRSNGWRDLKDHLHDQHGYQIETFETGARAGHAIRDILEDLVSRSSMALLVMSAEDQQHDGQLRARQNVIHEAGLFQGRLGFARAILLIEDGVEQFSNVQGIQHIKFGRGNIREAFGDVLATLRREFGGSGRQI